MASSVFQKIIQGEIPAHTVYEDDLVLAFLDINPISIGHTLVIPKEPAETLDALSDASAAAIGRILPRLSRAILRVTGASDFNILQNNGPLAHQAVPHVHFHIIPKHADGSGLGLEWPAGALSTDQAAELRTAIVKHL